MLNDFDDVNRILAELAAEGTIEPMAEPIDDDSCDPFDYAEVTGLWNEMYPESEPQTMVDDEGFVWYVS